MSTVAPAPKMESHQTQAALENARFLLDRGESRERVCARLGINDEALEQMFRRDKATR